MMNSWLEQLSCMKMLKKHCKNKRKKKNRRKTQETKRIWMDMKLTVKKM